MKYVLSAAAPIVAFMLHANAYAGNLDRGSGNSVVERIRALEEERNQAILQGDVAALDRMTSDDYTFITLRGELRTKAEILKDFRSGSIKYQSRFRGSGYTSTPETVALFRSSLAGVLHGNRSFTA